MAGRGVLATCVFGAFILHTIHAYTYDSTFQVCIEFVFIAIKLHPPLDILVNKSPSVNEVSMLCHM